MWMDSFTVQAKQRCSKAGGMVGGTRSRDSGGSEQTLYIGLNDSRLTKLVSVSASTSASISVSVYVRPGQTTARGLYEAR